MSQWVVEAGCHIVMGDHFICVLDLFSCGKVSCVHSSKKKKEKKKQFLLNRFWTLRGFFSHKNVDEEEDREGVSTSAALESWDFVVESEL